MMDLYKIKKLAACLAALVVFAGGVYGLPNLFPLSEVTPPKLSTAVSDSVSRKSSVLDVTPKAWDDVSPYVSVHGNVPFFEESELSVKDFETYSKRDVLGRCGTAYACLGPETMPTEERGKIGHVKPSGWHTVKYDCVDGKYLYNRCHLIGFQLAGENDNADNLITGTRFLNVEGMLPFENEIADYIRKTGNHVYYRVTPIFKDVNLVCDGVFLEAASVEDNGIRLCVYCYNEQPGVTIDHGTGDSRLAKVE